MSLLPPRPVPLETNPDSDKEPIVPPKSVLNLPDEVIPSSRGIPLHTRYTRRNHIPVTTFRTLVFVQVLENLHIRLNPDVMNVIELYTFERTHHVVLHKRIQHRRSLFREGDILDFLRPCKLDAHQSSFDEEYVLDCLIGRVLYGFDIHDNRYSSIDDPNPCEIMTNEGGLYLVPDQMSDWFLYQDGQCVSLPVLYRFKHCITYAKIITRSSGPYLRLVIKPVQSIKPGTDALVCCTEMDEQIKVDDSDVDSFTSYDIDQNLLTYSKSPMDDSLAAEIAYCWSTKRESVLVVVNPLTPKVAHLEESIDHESVFSTVLSNQYYSDTQAEVESLVELEKEDKKDDGKTQVEPTGLEFPIGKPQLKNVSEDFVSSYTTIGSASCTSFGSAHFHSRIHESEDESEDENHLSYLVEDKMSSRPSILVSKDPEPPIILELGAGVVGIYLHTMATPNPRSCCGRDSDLESMEL